MTSPSRSEGGFSLLVVVVIIFSLGAFAATVFLAIAPSQATRATDVTFQRADVLKAAIAKYKDNNGAVPATLQNLVTTTGMACSVNTDTVSANYRKMVGWCGPYVDLPVANAAAEFRTDGWGTAFQLTATELRSCGPDKTCGNTDDLTFTGF